MDRKLKVTAGNPLVMGTTVVSDGINFSVAADSANKCSLILYSKGTNDIIEEIVYTEDMKFGNVYSMLVHGLSCLEADYNFLIDGRIVTDPYAAILNNRDKWGEKHDNVTCSIIYHSAYDWKGDRHPDIDFSDTIIYRMHVRGFTMGNGSGTRHKGTFRGIVDKIPYLKKLGITMVELMPAYDFNEISTEEDENIKYMHIIDGRINYWGYTDANYFAPKTAFSSGAGSADVEFKDMVRELHKNGIEFSMEFYFTSDRTPGFILDCLRYWALNYHIDGIHVNCGRGVMEMIERDPALAGVKLFNYEFNGDKDYYNATVGSRRLGIFNDGFMIAARKFLKGDEDMVSSMMCRVKLNPPYAKVVNYMANHNTFTLMDMVSFDRKHNEANGEGGGDGADYNYSWNCGVEGATKRKKVTELRKRQVKNALALVLLSQGVPMIFAGDERGNSNRGNNNPYCQDNEISWTSWSNNSLSKELFEYTRYLIELRKQHKILHMQDELRAMDYKSFGYPDISYHGTEAWYSDFNHVDRQFAVMYCGKYANEKCDIYIAYNMHWEEKKFGIPNPPENKKWEQILFTHASKTQHPEIKSDKYCIVPGRSIVVLISEPIS